MDNLTYGLIESNSKLEKENQTLKLSHDDLERQLSSMGKINNSLLKELNALKEQLKGGVIVPREPTFAMTESGLMTLKKSESGYYIGSVEHIFKAMIEAVEKDDE